MSHLGNEVTYAELTLPRNNGYTPLKKLPPATHPKPQILSPLNNDLQPGNGANVIYARIDHLANCPNQKTGATMPLLVNTSSGGVSPSSLLNTSCDSSSTGNISIQFHND